MDWQAYIAGAIVTVTVAVFSLRIIRRQPTGGCGHGCGCCRKVTIILETANEHQYTRLSICQSVVSEELDHLPK